MYDMKKMFIIINSLYGGGAEHVAQRLSERWSEMYELVVISLAPFSTDDYVFKGKLISIADSYRGLTWFGRIKNASRKIDQLAAEQNVDIMISFLQNANLCLMLSKYKKARKIISIRNFVGKQYSGFKLYMWEYLMKKYFRRADCVVSVSKQIAKEMEQRYHIAEEKNVCIYNPYDTKMIQELGCEALSEDEQLFFSKHKVIANMGHIHVQKGQFHLVRVLNELRKDRPEYGLVIIGKDRSEYADRLKRLIAEMGLSEHVLFTGTVTNPYKYLSKSFVFAFPSLYEGFPNALVEAMACGLPVIAADCKSGPREILHPNAGEVYGHLISDDQIKWLGATEELTVSETESKRIIEVLANNPNEYTKFSQLALKRAQQFTVESILSDWERVLE